MRCILYCSTTRITQSCIIPTISLCCLTVEMHKVIVPRQTNPWTLPYTSMSAMDLSVYETHGSNVARVQLDSHRDRTCVRFDTFNPTECIKDELKLFVWGEIEWK